jgi:peptide methionine sulfoxide reductase msrA/msrB
MTKEIYLAGGCFWGTEKYLSLIRGVTDTAVGYANGKTENPTYQQVCHNDTGHAETVRVTYDPMVLSLEKLLEVYYRAIDPTSVNRQGNDVGTQYRTGIYFTDPSDRAVIDASVEKLQTKYKAPVAIEVGPVENFYPAEEYHQKYLDKNPGGYCHIGKDKFEYALAANALPAASSQKYAKRAKDDLKKELSPLAYAVNQESATEPPFKNPHFDNFKPGIYVDVTTGEPLFTSRDKFDSGCGWPAFSRPIDNNLLDERLDLSHGMVRTEVRSKTGNAHLGHVFSDGPKESGGLRYCINSAALRFIPLEDMEKEGYGAYISLVK